MRVILSSATPAKLTSCLDQLGLNATATTCGWTFPVSACEIITILVSCIVLNIILSLGLITFGMTSAESRRISRFLQPCLTVFQVVLAVRTWAVWQRNRVLGIILAILLIVTTVVNCGFLAHYLKSMKSTFPFISRSRNLVEDFAVASSPYDGFRGCYVTNSSRSLSVDFIVLTVLELCAYSLFGAFLTSNFSPLHSCPCPNDDQRIPSVYVLLNTSIWELATHLSKIYLDRLGNARELSNVIHRDGEL